ncbi:MAG: hypothetical protein WC900_04040 [Oscillospiraceae bacterium]
MTCPECHSENISLQAVNEKKPMDCFSALVCVGLLFVPFIGWIVLIDLFTRKDNKTCTYGLCSQCGNRFIVKSAKEIRAAKALRKRILIYILIFVLALVIIVAESK